MSDIAREAPLPEHADDVHTEAAAWVAERRYADDWRDEDQARLDDWLAQSPAHMVAYWRLDAAWRRTEWLSAIRPASDATEHRMLPLMLKMAAAFAVIAVIGVAAADYLLTPHDRTFSTAVGGHETVAFADGSRIELNTDTSLRARMNADQRVIWLEKGEAFFQVKHDAAHPFIVMAGNHRITDLGTKFLVRRDPKKLEVAVSQGRVWFDAHTPSQSTLLMPGDVAVASANSVSVTRQSARELATELGWRQGVLVFKHTSLADAAAEFNRYNQRKLVIADAEAGAMKIDGTFRATNVEAFARIARTVLGLNVADDSNRIVVSR
ncbi:MAG TPA: FecR domain-containing protein [Rhizomicrobium sp.]|nr:FecR domain-containing protein [Rhizomicrobium sp.]